MGTKKLSILLLALAVTLAIVIPVATVSAAAKPVGSKLVLNITYKVVNDEDSGFAGYWALDSYNKHIQVWQQADGSFYATGSYEGKWQTFAGALSPMAGLPFSKDGRGTFNGGWVGTFTAAEFTSAFGNIGTYDFGGTKADIRLGKYGAGQIGNTNSFDALGNYFPGYSNFTYVSWGWTYKYQNQRWINADTGSSGDIVF